MKKIRSVPQWIVAKRLRRKAKRTGKKSARCHATVYRKWSKN